MDSLFEEKLSQLEASSLVTLIMGIFWHKNNFGCCLDDFVVTEFDAS